MADFFKNETRRRITAGIVTGVVAMSTVIANVAPALAETPAAPATPVATAPATPATGAGTPTPANPPTGTPAATATAAPATTPTPATPATPAPSAGTPSVANPPAATPATPAPAPSAGTPTPANPPAGTVTPAATPLAPSSITFTQDNIPNVKQGVPANKMAVQFVSDFSLDGSKFVGDPTDQVTAPSGLTDPDGHTIVKWVTDNGDELQPGQTTELQYVNGQTYHAVWQDKDNGDDVQYRLVIDANGGQFEGGVTSSYERHDYLPAEMHNVTAAGKVTRAGYTLLGFSRDKTATTPLANSLTSPVSIDDAEHTPGHTTRNALPGKTDEIYTLYAIWKDNSAVTTDSYDYVFDANGGTYSTASGASTATVTKTTDSDVSGISAPAIPSRSGFTFIGWGTTPAATEAQSVGINSANFSSITPTDSTAGTVTTHARTVYAIWKANAATTTTGHTNTYIFDANGGTIEGTTNQSSSIDGQDPTGIASVAAPKAVKPGYDFVGWAKDPGASVSFVIGTDHVDFSGVTYQSVADAMGNVADMYHVYAVYKIAATPSTPTTVPGVPTDGVPPTIDTPVAGKNTIMFYSGKLNKGETSTTDTGTGAKVIAPNREYSLADGTMVKRWISTDGATILTPGASYDADAIANKVFVADYVTPAPQDTDPTQNYPQNASHIQLVYHGNGGKTTGGDDTYVVTGNLNETDLPDAANFAREGYTFKGWARAAADTEPNVTVANDKVNLKSIGSRDQMTDQQNPTKVVVVYNVYAVWQKNDASTTTPDVTNGTITPGDNGDNYLGIPIHHVQGEPEYVNDGTTTQPTTTRSTSTTRGHWVRKAVKRSALPDTGDATSAVGIFAGLGSILVSLGLFRKRKND